MQSPRACAAAADVKDWEVRESMNTRLSDIVGSVIDRSKKFNGIARTTGFSVENERHRQESAAAATSDSDSLDGFKPQGRSSYSNQRIRQRKTAWFQHCDH
jgi:hypothetical protein